MIDLPTFNRLELARKFQEHGLHPHCRGCPRVEECPQYDAPGLKRFECFKRKNVEKIK